MKELLSENGSIYVHCDWRVSALLRLHAGRDFWIENFRQRDHLVLLNKHGAQRQRTFDSFHETHDYIIYSYSEDDVYLQSCNDDSTVQDRSGTQANVRKMEQGDSQERMAT